MSGARQHHSIQRHSALSVAQGVPRAVIGQRKRAIYGVLVGTLAVLVLALSGCSPSLPAEQAAAGPPPHKDTTAVDDYNKANDYQYSGRCDRAIPLYLRAIAKNGMYVNAYVGLGNCYQSASIGSFSAAITEYDKAIQIDPTNYGLYIDRAGAEVNNGSTGAATNDLNIALNLAPPQVPAYVGPGSISASFASYGDFADAIKAFDKAIALAPSNASLYEQRANIYLKMQDNGRAFADYQRALAVAPFTFARANIYADLATVYDNQQDFPDAYRAIHAAIQLQPNNAHFYVQSGSIHQDGGDNAAALQLYNRAIQLVSRGPDAEAAHEGKGDILAAMGNTKDAIAEYRLASRLASRSDGVIQPRLKSKIKALQTGQS